MRAALKTTNPDEIEFTLTVTMPLKEWRELREAMEVKASWVATRFCQQITEMVLHADKHFWPTDNEPES